MLPRYNIAACPVDPVARQGWFDLASRLAVMADGYCLAPGKALPHVTLCQFRAPDDKAARTVVQDFLGRSLILVPNGFYLNPGANEHRGKFWLGHSVGRDPLLMATQKAVVDQLSAHVADVFTRAGDDYFPHFTMARIAVPAINLSADFFDHPLMNQKIECHIMLGHSDENGQFLSVVAGT